MKMLKTFMLAVAATAAISCSVEITPEVDVNPEVKLVPMTFSASADIDEKTKVSLNEGLTIWDLDDEIAVINADGTLLGTFKATEVNGAQATFTGMVNEEETTLVQDEPTYYAVYPASAYKGKDFTNPANGRLFIEIPANQTAVAGSFDRKAFVSVGSSNGTHLYFKNLCSVIKFQLKETEGVKSVKFTANDNPNLAGNQNVYITNRTSHSWGEDFDGRTSFNTITLNAPAEGFQTETDYYFTLRPFGAEASGVKFYVETNNDFKLRASEKPFKAIRNKVHSAGTLDTEGYIASTTLYDAYNNGMEINVAGKIITKKVYGEATRISNDNTVINTDGVYFIDKATEDVTITHNPKKTIIISNHPEQATLKRGNSTLRVDATANNDYFILSNINFSTGMTSGNMMSGGGSGDIETILFNKCKIEVPKDMLLLYSQINILNFNMTDCDIRLHTASGEKNLIQTSTESIYETLTFKNNIFYCTDGDLTGFRLFSNNKATLSYLEFRNNTIASVYCKASYGYITAKSITAGDVMLNLLYLPKYTTYLDGTYIGILHIADKADSHLNMPANLAFYDYATLPTHRAKVSYYSNNGTIYNKCGEANPIPSPDFINGVFTTVDKGSDKFSTYGARR